MSLPRSQSAAHQRDPAGMDEILASIRRIIDEDPVQPRHRASLSPTLPETAARSPALIDSETTRRAAQFGLAEDDVLAELLAPGPAEPQSVKTAQIASVGREFSAPVVATVAGGTGVFPVVEAIGDAAVGDAAAASEMVDGATNASVTMPSLHSDQDSHIESVPSAEDVLAALARGLSVAPETVLMQTTVVPVTPAPVAPTSVVIDAPVPAVLERADETAFEAVEASPAEAVSAAVAAVAAVNAAAVQTGARLRPMPVAESAAAVAAAAQPDTDLQTVETSRQAEVPPPALPTAACEAAAAAADTPMDEPLPAASAPAISQPVTPSGVPVASELVPQPPVSFEDAIAGMLRPMLRDWLDDNMPRMVEKALKDELAGAGGLLAGVSKHGRPQAA